MFPETEIPRLNVSSGANRGGRPTHDPQDLFQMTKGPGKLNNWLVGQGHPSEKYEFVSWDDDSNPILMGK